MSNKEITPETKHTEFVRTLQKSKDLLYLSVDSLAKLYQEFGRVTVRQYPGYFWQLRVNGENLLLEFCTDSPMMLGMFEERRSVSVLSVPLTWSEQGVLFYTKRSKDGRPRYHYYLLKKEQTLFFDRLHLKKLYSNIPKVFENIWENHDKQGAVQHTDFMFISKDGKVSYNRETREHHRSVQVPDDSVVVAERYRCDLQNRLDRCVFAKDFNTALRFEKDIHNFFGKEL